MRARLVLACTTTAILAVFPLRVDGLDFLPERRAINPSPTEFLAVDNMSITGTIEATDFVIPSGISVWFEGDVAIVSRGDVVIKGQLLSRTSPSASVAGNGGNLVIRSQGQVVIDGTVRATSGVQAVSAYVQNAARDGGNGGSILIVAPRVSGSGALHAGDGGSGVAGGNGGLGGTVIIESASVGSTEQGKLALYGGRGGRGGDGVLDFNDGRGGDGGDGGSALVVVPGSPGAPGDDETGNCGLPGFPGLMVCTNGGLGGPGADAVGGAGGDGGNGTCGSDGGNGGRGGHATSGCGGNGGYGAICSSQYTAGGNGGNGGTATAGRGGNGGDGGCWCGTGPGGDGGDGGSGGTATGGNGGNGGDRGGTCPFPCTDTDRAGDGGNGGNVVQGDGGDGGDAGAGEPYGTPGAPGSGGATIVGTPGTGGSPNGNPGNPGGLTPGAIGSSGTIAACVIETSIGITVWDEQHVGTQQHRVSALSSDDCIHFSWTYSDHGSPFGYSRLEPYVVYTRWDPMTGRGGNAVFGAPDSAAYTTIDVLTNGNAQVAYHRYTPAPQVDVVPQQVPCQSGFGAPWGLEGRDPRTEYPMIDVDHGSPDVIHLAAVIGDLISGYDLLYWRYDGSAWQGPMMIDTTCTPSHTVVASPGSNEVSYVFARPQDGDCSSAYEIVYYESQSNGLDWLTGTGLGAINRNQVTTYQATGGCGSVGTEPCQSAYYDLTAIYDYDGTLHIVWPAWYRPDWPGEWPRAQADLYHWDNQSASIHHIVDGRWPPAETFGGHTAQFNLHLAKPTLGVGNGALPCGDGTNLNYLYLLYTQFGGYSAMEQDDRSLRGYYNGDLYFTVSRDGGQLWKTPDNLTNTKFPLCDPETAESYCRSEHWGTIAKHVDDVAHITYIEDRDAGSAIRGEGLFTINYVEYMQIGAEDGHLCFPCDCACHADPICDGMTNILDVVQAVNVAFRGHPPTYDADCPAAREDVDCDGVVSVIDVVKFVNVGIRGFDPMTQFCDPCACDPFPSGCP